jgi:glucose-6-phosphate 1-dehydrogenase
MLTNKSDMNPISEPGKEEVMSNAPAADTLVFFGATGDLAHKKIFPALQALAKRSRRRKRSASRSLPKAMVDLHDYR